jgi:hypothetical protein
LILIFRQFSAIFRRLFGDFSAIFRRFFDDFSTIFRSRFFREKCLRRKKSAHSGFVQSEAVLRPVFESFPVKKKLEGLERWTQELFDHADTEKMC